MTEASSPPHAQPGLIAQHPPLASWTSRAKALTVDWLMLLVPAGLLFLVLVVPELGNTPTPDSETDFALLGGLIMFLALMLLVGIVWVLYVVLMMIRKGERNGQTWGKQIVGVRAVRDNGEPWRFGSAALREVLLKLITALVLPSLLIPIVPGLVNFLWPPGTTRTERFTTWPRRATSCGRDAPSVQIGGEGAAPRRSGSERLPYQPRL